MQYTAQLQLQRSSLVHTASMRLHSAPQSDQLRTACRRSYLQLPLSPLHKVCRHLCQGRLKCLQHTALLLYYRHKHGHRGIANTRGWTKRLARQSRTVAPCTVGWAVCIAI